MKTYASLAAWLTALLVPVLLVLCVPVALAKSAFYQASPAELSGPPGSLIRIEPMRGAPLAAAAYRMLYRSTGLNGEPIAVSGVAVIPASSAPASGRPVVAWAHPTTGVASRCAPSQALLVFQTMQGLRQLVERGDIVVATDYPGLGTAGPHPYLVGISEGRAVLDSVRAVRHLREAQAGPRFTVWGHSQGGHAALYAGELAGGYAPELQLLGVAAAAPATDLETLLREDYASVGGRNITAMTLWSWARVFGAPTAEVLEPDAAPTIDRLAGDCIESIYDVFMRRRDGKPLEQHFLSVDDITRVEPWRALLIQNIPHALPPAVPVFVAQGSDDVLVRPHVTAAYVRMLCANGSAVRMLVIPGVGHGLAAYSSASAAVDWMTDRFNRKTVPDDCVGAGTLAHR